MLFESPLDERPLRLLRSRAAANCHLSPLRHAVIAVEYLR